MSPASTQLNSQSSAPRVANGITYQRRPMPVVQPRIISDITPSPVPDKVHTVSTTKPALPRQSPSVVLRREATLKPTPSLEVDARTSHSALTALGVALVIAGFVITGLAFRSSHHAAAQDSVETTVTSMSGATTNY